MAQADLNFQLHYLPEWRRQQRKQPRLVYLLHYRAPRERKRDVLPLLLSAPQLGKAFPGWYRYLLSYCRRQAYLQRRQQRRGDYDTPVQKHGHGDFERTSPRIVDEWFLPPQPHFVPLHE